MGKKKGGKGKKGGGSKGKKAKKEVEPEEPPPPPDLNVFINIRRKNQTLCIETFEYEIVKELKIQVATILRQFAEDIQLFSMYGKEPEEMEEMEKPKKEEKKKDDKNSRGRGKKDDKKEKEEPPRPPGPRTLNSYGFTPGTATLFKPGIIGLAYRGDDGEFEKLDMTPYSEFPVIPEEIKMHLRNYVPPAPPPPKKKGNAKGPPKK